MVPRDLNARHWLDGATSGPRKRATSGHAPQPQVAIWRSRAFCIQGTNRGPAR